jgi:hypothetical protein
MCRKEILVFKFAIFMILSFYLLACSSTLPNEKELIAAVKKHYGYTDTEYTYKTKIIKVEENDIKNISYSHVGWVDVTQIKTGNSWKTQFGLKKEGHTWGPTRAQLEEEIADLNKLQMLLNRQQH